MADIRDLIIKCKKGDRLSQYFLFERMKRRWMGVCYRYVGNTAEADDVFQESAIKILSSIDQLRDIDLFDAWAKRIVINQAINHLKARNSYSIAVDSYSETSGDREEGEEEIIGNMNAEELLAMINTMPEGYRMVFSLYMIDGYKHREIAEALNISEATSRSQLKKARKCLRTKIEQIKPEKNAKIV
jgi:RNA polymerase sigma-70 factor (ECF subfamily)